MLVNKSWRREILKPNQKIITCSSTGHWGLRYDKPTMIRAGETGQDLKQNVKKRELFILLKKLQKQGKIVSTPYVKGPNFRYVNLDSVRLQDRFGHTKSLHLLENTNGKGLGEHHGTEDGGSY